MGLNEYKTAWMKLKQHYLMELTRPAKEDEDNWDLDKVRKDANNALHEMERIEIAIVFGEEEAE